MKTKFISIIGSGTTLEIYDSYILGFMLSTMNRLFFPDNLHGELAAITTFSILFFVRPISAIFWGILGDKYGKLLVFKHSILFMAIATCAIGLLPTYAQVGIVAPILLLLCRLLQGISISGEFGSSVVLCYEQSSPRQRLKNNSVLYIFIFSGILIASGMTHIVNHKNIPPYIAWRIPFIFGGICGFIIYIIRQKLHINEKQHPEVNIKAVLKNYKHLLISICAIFIINLNWLYFSAIASIFGGALIGIKINQLSLGCSLLVLLSAFIFGKYFAEKVHYRMLNLLYIFVICMYLTGIILVGNIKLTLALSIFYGIESIIAGIIFVSVPVMIIDNYIATIRNSIYNIANNFSTAIIVGVMPFIINLLNHNFSQQRVAILLTINLLISIIALLSLQQLKKSPAPHN